MVVGKENRDEKEEGCVIEYDNPNTIFALFCVCWECLKVIPKEKRGMYVYFCSKKCEEKHYKKLLEGINIDKL